MKRFSIRQLERFSGIKPHTIRTWETRYGLLNPERSAGNTRYYSVNDLELLLDVVLLNQYGQKIGHLSSSDTRQLKTYTEGLESNTAILQCNLNRLIIALYKCDIERFETLLNDCSRKTGYSNTIHRLIVPFLEKTEILSYKDDSPEVHFAVTAIRKKLLVAIDQVEPVVKVKKKALLFLPEGEHYDLMLLYIYFSLKEQGVTVYYLGTNISAENVEKVVLSKVPDELYVYSFSPKKYHFETLINFLQKESPNSSLTIVTAENSAQRNTSRVKFTHFSDFISVEELSV